MPNPSDSDIALTPAGVPPIDSPLIVLQGTPFCNIDCSYCYLGDRLDTHRMSDDVLLATYRRVFSSSLFQGNLRFLWHAGEPLSLPIAFYEQAVQSSRVFSERFAKRSSHAIQTNGLLLDDKWIDFIQRDRIRLGLSLDGPADLHDAFRKDRRGRGTHDRVMAAVRLLQNTGTTFRVICLLTVRSLAAADEMFAFFADHRIADVGFNIDEIEGANQHSSFGSRPDRTTYELFRAFMRRMLELNERSGGPLRIREFGFYGPFLRRVNPDRLTRDARNRPLGIISVDIHGNFTTYCPELLGVDTRRFGSFTMGNVLHDEIAAIFSNPLFQAVTAEIQAGISRCRSECSYFELCGGGAPANKYFETGRFDVSETMYCRIHKKALTDAVLDYLGVRAE
jgi:uncharacterized protein